MVNAWTAGVNISLFQAASALNANARWQEVITENLSSSSIPGYKRQDLSFSAIEAGKMPPTADRTSGAANVWSLPQATSATSFAQGEMRFTGQNTDVALQGAGFFEVQLPNGSLAYTRDGEFHQNAQGQIVTKQGYLVMSDGGPIQLDRNSSGPLGVSSDGTVTQGTDVRGTLKVVDFNKPELLTQGSGGLFLAKDGSLEINTDSKPTVRQGYLELANTTAVTEMVNLISVMRSSEANQKVFQMQDERMGKAISELAGQV